MTTKYEAEKVWFTADTHFHHKKIIRYCKRPFINVWHMNKVLKDNWKALVSNRDLVFHLGDFGFGKYPQIEPVLRELPGTKILLRGNHDRASLTKLREAGFYEVYKNPIEIEIGGQIFKLSHRPTGVEEGQINLCGHVHDKWTTSDFSINIGVDAHGFKPTSLNEINTIVPELRRGIRI